MRRARGRLLAAVAASMLAVGACDAGPPPDPYTVLDRALVLGWDQVEARLGFGVDIQPAPMDDIVVPPTRVTVDPSSIRLAIDNATGRWRLAVDLPLETLGVDPATAAMVLGGAASIQAEALHDGAFVYAKGPIVTQYVTMLAGFGGAAPEGDLTGWLRLGPGDALGNLPGAILGTGVVPGAGLNVPLPTPGDPVTLKSFLESLGVEVTHAGFESDGGRDLHHLSATLNLAALAQSPTLAQLTGMGADELQGLFQAASEVHVGASAWVDKESGRLSTLRVDLQITNAQSPGTAYVVLQLAPIPAATTFDPPSEFVDVDLGKILQPSLGFGSEGGDDVEGVDAPPMELPSTP